MLKTSLSEGIARVWPAENGRAGAARLSIFAGQALTGNHGGARPWPVGRLALCGPCGQCGQLSRCDCLTAWGGVIM